MLSVRNLVKTYKSKKADTVVALNNVSIDFPETGLVFLLGKSGSGKSTLLNAIGGLDTFDSGEIIIKGKSSKDFTQSDFDSYRNTFIGFIFQEYNILENFTVYKNLALALELQGKKADKEEIHRLLEQVEMTQYAKRKPNQLSGGQKQRVAIARALVKNPEIIMADEPTGALDSNTGKQVMDTLKKLSKTKLVIIVSHDREFAEIYGDRIIELKDGKIIHDVTKKEIEAQQTASGIKIIDNSIIYIKKGQEVSEKDMKSIVKIISENSQRNDTFISFDKKANDELKAGAKINDDGNKEAFLKTEPEDIRTKNYNPNSLKLIKSRLKFSDSFKMGASALKNKVGKLIFTILLSFFAFTVFGIVDAFSCWNRADSVYEAMKINKTKVVMLQKQTYNAKGKYYNDDATRISDLEMLKQNFNDRTIKSVVGDNYNSISSPRFGEDGNVFNISNAYGQEDPLYSTRIGGFVCFSNQDIDDFDFEIYKGRLPVSDDEIAISKYTMEALIKKSESNTKTEEQITEDNILDRDGDNVDETLRVYISGFDAEAKIVGVIDDKTDYSKYKDMDSEKRMKESNSIEQFFSNSFMQIAYVNQAKYDEIADQGVETSLVLGGDRVDIYLGKESFKSLESDWIEDSDDYDWSHYNCKVGNEYYSLTKYEDGDWYIFKLNFEDNSEERLYYYYYSDDPNQEYLRRETNYTEFNDEEMQAFFNGTGEGIFGADANGDKIPDKFEPGRYPREKFVYENILYYKNNASLIDSNGKFVDIGKDSAIIPEDMAMSMMGIDYETKIDEGFTIDLSKRGKLIKTLTIVGVSSGYSRYYFSEEFIEETINPQFAGYSMIATYITGNDGADEEFIRFCEGGKDGQRWIILNNSTSILNQFEGIINDVATVFLYIAIGFAVFASLMLMNFITTSISYKKREIGVLRALGARGSDIFGIFFNESMVIAMINFVLAAIATVAGCIVINSVFVTKLGMDIVLLNVGIRQVVLIFAVSVVAAFIGSFLPTFKISRKKPIDAINNR